MSDHLLLLVTLIFLIGSTASSFSGDDHRYNVGDPVPLFVNKAGPLNNPSETYEYYGLPFCRPEPVIRERESLGEVLSGDRPANSLYKLNFREDKSRVTLCEKKLETNEVAKFRSAITNDFYFQMYYDNLPFWGYVGKVEKTWSFDEERTKHLLFTDVRFDALYNENQIIEIRAFSDPNHVVDITDDVEMHVVFTYSVFWNATSTKYSNRMERYSEPSFQSTLKQIHWFSLLNSVVIIVLLMGFLTLLFMRSLKNDLNRYSAGDEEDSEVGWKNLHGDVFRYPKYAYLFCSVLGCGTQLLTMVCFLFALTFFGVLYPYSRGSMGTSLVVIYTLTSFVAGYTTASSQRRFFERKWKHRVLMTGFLSIVPVFLTMTFINSVAILYGATAALPFGTICVLLLVYAFLNIPLLVLGGVIGDRFSSEFEAPCPTKRLQREIPALAWYRKTPGQMFIGGLLPFSAIALELHQLYATLWGYKVYTLPGILFLTFVVLILLTAMLSVALTYIQLSVEDHEWWWRSFLRGGSTAIFMFGYCVYYYMTSQMSGLMQMSVFFGYNACICYGLFLVLGTIGFRVSLMLCATSIMPSKVNDSEPQILLKFHCHCNLKKVRKEWTDEKNT